MSSSSKTSKRLAAASALCLVLVLVLAAVPAWAQGPRRGPGGDTTTFDPLNRLKQALSTAGAPALTSAQETRINTLITNFRNAHPRPTPSATLDTARSEYDKAVINADIGAAAIQAGIIASEMSAASTARLKDEATFAIDVVKELRTNGDQVGALTKSIGTTGTARLILGLAGGMGGPGRGPRGFGPPPADR